MSNKAVPILRKDAGLAYAGAVQLTRFEILACPLCDERVLASSSKCVLKKKTESGRCYRNRPSHSIFPSSSPRR